MRKGVGRPRLNALVIPNGPRPTLHPSRNAIQGPRNARVARKSTAKTQQGVRPDCGTRRRPNEVEKLRLGKVGGGLRQELEALGGRQRRIPQALVEPVV